MTFETLLHISKLFAIVVNKNSDNTKEIANSEFSKFLNLHIEEKYIKDFEDNFAVNLDTYSSFASNKKTALNSVKLISIAEEIKENLYPQYRIAIVFYLINLLSKVKNINNSIDFLILLSELLGISKENYEKIFNFICDEKEEEKKSFKYFSNDEKLLIKYCYFEEYQIIIIKILSENIRINNEKALLNDFYILQTTDFLSYNKQEKFYYSDFIGKRKKEKENFAINVRNLEIKIKEKTIVHNFSCDFFSGELIGIIGKSGSGKTTLLKSLASLNINFDGDIYCNNVKKAFVNQFNTFVPFFSVKEHLKQRLDFLNFPKREQNKIIDSVLESVDLSNEKNKIAINSDNSPKELSGGQLKRLAIAMELLANPSFLLLDEATSGLASNDAVDLLNILKALAKENKIVITSIHQPDYECFMMFDKILIIDDGGYPIYYDLPLYSIDYFRNIFKRIDKNSLFENYFNPSLLLQIINEKKLTEGGEKTGQREKTPQELYSIFIEKQKFDNFQKTNGNNKTKNFQQKSYNKIQSLFANLKFNIFTDLKNKLRIFLLLFVPFVAGILLSSLCKYSDSETYNLFYNPNIAVWILIILLSGFFIGLISSAHEFIFLRQYHKIENLIYDKNLSLNIAKIIKYFFLSAIQAFLLLVFSVFILKIQFHFFFLFILLWAIIFCGNLISLLLSKFFNNISTIYLLIPLIVVPQMIFSGAMIKYKYFNDNFPKINEIPVAADFMPIRWAAEACIVNFFIDNNYQKAIFKDKQRLYEAEEFLKYNLEKNPNKDFYIKQKEDARNNIEKKLQKIKDKEKLILKETNIEINKICYNNFDNTIYKTSNDFFSNSKFLIGTKYICGHQITTDYYNLLVLLIFNLSLGFLIIIIKNK